MIFSFRVRLDTWKFTETVFRSENQMLNVFCTAVTVGVRLKCVTTNTRCLEVNDHYCMFSS